MKKSRKIGRNLSKRKGIEKFLMNVEGNRNCFIMLLLYIYLIFNKLIKKMCNQISISNKTLLDKIGKYFVQEAITKHSR